MPNQALGPFSHTDGKNRDFSIRTSEMLHKQGFLEVYEIFFNRGIEGQDSDRSHYDRHQEYKIN
jgi:hypothetical protein